MPGWWAALTLVFGSQAREPCAMGAFGLHLWPSAALDALQTSAGLLGADDQGLVSLRPLFLMLTHLLLEGRACPRDGFPPPAP